MHLSRTLFRISASTAMYLVCAATPDEELLDTPITDPALFPILSKVPKVVHDLLQEYVFGCTKKKGRQNTLP
jgi:hypothetical protein